MGREVIRRPLEAPNDVPRGGSAGQALVKTGSEDYAMAWEQVAAAEDHVFSVADYGADADQVDGSNDNLEAFQEAWAAAEAYARASRTRSAVLYVPPRPDPYIWGAATTKGGSTLGNSQLPIPVVDPDEKKLNLVIVGCHDAASSPHWLQDTGPAWGSTIKSTLTGLTNDVTHGAPFMIGGPTPQHGYGSGTAEFSNVCITIDGIGLLTPVNPTMGGFDFRGLAQMAFRNGAVAADAPSTGTGSMDANPATHDWTTGLACPQNFNNDRNEIGSFACFGQAYGLAATEHLWAARVALIYCGVGIFVQATSDNIHSSAYGSVSIEATESDAIQTAASSPHGAPVHMAAVSVETIGGFHVKDANNALTGYIAFTKLDAPLGSASGITVDGAGNVEIIAANQARGPVTAPSFPAAGDGNAITNPFWRHANVYVSGGSITAIKVNGTTTGVTAGLVRVPSGKTISWTGSGSPTWVWVLD